uniref:Predicted protein n=1 Tax=Hordeum vulgare subsp. vulgare TaxID=112509 RepID=F2DZD5_HORVV|nr:predicted protein [Hordeum vulgare subsp. vulgare]
MDGAMRTSALPRNSSRASPMRSFTASTPVVLAPPEVSGASGASAGSYAASPLLCPVFG